MAAPSCPLRIREPLGIDRTVATLRRRSIIGGQICSAGSSRSTLIFRIFRSVHCGICFLTYSDESSLPKWQKSVSNTGSPVTTICSSAMPMFHSRDCSTLQGNWNRNFGHSWTRSHKHPSPDNGTTLAAVSEHRRNSPLLSPHLFPSHLPLRKFAQRILSLIQITRAGIYFTIASPKFVSLNAFGINHKATPTATLIFVLQASDGSYNVCEAGRG